MKYHILFTIILVFWCKLTNCQEKIQIKSGFNIDSLVKAKQKEATGKPLPSFIAYYHGKVFTNENLKGKTVFINFWYASCAPCIAELDGLNELYMKLKNNKKFEFVSFTFEKSNVIKKMIQKYKIKYNIFSITEDDCERLNQKSGFPTSIIIDSIGIVKYFKVGGPLNKAEVQDVLFNDYYPRILKEL